MDISTKKLQKSALNQSLTILTCPVRTLLVSLLIHQYQLSICLSLETKLESSRRLFSFPLNYISSITLCQSSSVLILLPPPLSISKGNNDKKKKTSYSTEPQGSLLFSHNLGHEDQWWDGASHLKISNSLVKCSIQTFPRSVVTIELTCFHGQTTLKLSL